MLRALFEKKGNAVYISHLDLMRLFQRAFKRAGFPLTHTQGFNPRPSVSIALPMSVGVESCCELLDFDLDGENVDCEQIKDRLNETLVDGVRILDVYPQSRKIREIAYLDCTVTLEYDSPVFDDTVDKIRRLFLRDELIMEKRNRNGVRQENIIPMIRSLEIELADAHTIRLDGRLCCQEPALNPSQIVAAIEQYLPECKPDFHHCERLEIYDTNETIYR